MDVCRICSFLEADEEGVLEELLREFGAACFLGNAIVHG
jgi:hypothetical protein